MCSVLGCGLLLILSIFKYVCCGPDTERATCSCHVTEWMSDVSEYCVQILNMGMSAVCAAPADGSVLAFERCDVAILDNHMPLRLTLQLLRTLTSLVARRLINFCVASVALWIGLERGNSVIAELLCGLRTAVLRSVCKATTWVHAEMLYISGFPTHSLPRPLGSIRTPTAPPYLF